MESKEIFITMSDGNKKAEFQISNFNENHQLAVMDGLFKFFDINVDFAEMATIYHKTGNAYKEFYGDKKEVALTEVNEPKVIKDHVFKKEYETALSEIEKPIHEKNIRIVDDGIILYQCHYICPSCGKRANRYIKKYERNTRCHECNKEMKVESATETPLEQDVYGNYFIAGLFKKQKSRSEELERITKEVKEQK